MEIKFGLRWGVLHPLSSKTANCNGKGPWRTTKHGKMLVHEINVKGPVLNGDWLRANCAASLAGFLSIC